MRRLLTPVLLISLLLTGCGSAAPERKIEELIARCAAAEEVSFRAEVCANIGAEVFSCTLRCAHSAEETRIEVLEPALIAGVKARLRDGEAHLEYEDVILSLAGVELQGLHPIAAMPLLMSALRSGHVVRAWMERTEAGECIAAQLYAGDLAELTLWFDAASLAPLHAELAQSGTVVLRCEISEFALQ